MFRLGELRSTHKISQKKIADMLGVSRSAVSMWEIEASQPDNQTLCKIAEIFNVSVDYLLGQTNEKNTPVNNRGAEYEDMDIRRIERARKNMPQHEKEKMMNILKASFEEFFSEDYIDEDTNE